MSFLETLVILLVAVIVLGPKRLPEVARKLGKWSGMVRRASDEFKRQLMTMDQAVEQSVRRETADIDALVPEVKATLSETSDTSSPVPANPLNVPPPERSPDDFWDATPVAGGLASEPSDETSLGTASVVAASPEPASPAVEVTLNPSSYLAEEQPSAPRSLGLRPTEEVSRG